MSECTKSTLCSQEWLGLLTIVLLVLSNWYQKQQEVQTANKDEKKQKRLITNLATMSARVRRSKRGFVSHDTAEWVWMTLYALQIAALFVYFYADDACRCGGTLQDQGLEMTTWILIILNLLSNKLWNFAASSKDLRTAAWFAATLSIVETLTAAALAVVLFWQAAAGALYYSASVFVLYTFWSAYIAYIDVFTAAYIERVSRNKIAI